MKHTLKKLLSLKKHQTPSTGGTGSSTDSRSLKALSRTGQVPNIMKNTKKKPTTAKKAVKKTAAKQPAKKIAAKTAKKAVKKTAAKKSVKKVAKKAVKKTAAKKTAGKAGKKKPLVMAPDEKSFWVTNGDVLNSLLALRDALAEMENAVYSYHAAKNQNDFAVWVDTVLCDSKCAKELAKAASPSKAKTIVNKHLKVYSV